MKILAILLLFFSYTPGGANKRTKVHISMQDVGDIIFTPMKVDLNSLYVERLMLRFSDPWTQIVIISRTDGVDVTQYTVDSKAGIAEMFQKLPRFAPAAAATSRTVKA